MGIERADRIDTDIAFRHLHGGGFGQANHCMLGSGIGADFGCSPKPGHGAYVNDAATVFFHGSNLMLHTEHHPFHIHVHLLVQHFLGELIKRDKTMGDAGIVHRHIQVAKLRQGRFHHGLAVRFAGHITTQRRHFDTLLRKPLGLRIQGIHIDVPQHQRGPTLAQLFRQQLAEAAGSTGDQCRLAGKIEDWIHERFS